LTQSPAHPTHTSYDVIPYESRPFSQTHPDRLATIGQLFGIKTVLADRARVLELGCAAGGNLIPHAVLYPNSHFVGIDYSSRQIAEAQAQVKALGLTNIEFKHASIADVDASYGKFDYIICHGVFSWISLDLQEKVLAITNENLNPNGIAYISYNVYPGWHMSGMLRDMMIYHAGRFVGVADKIAQARALLDFLTNSVPAQLNSYSAMLKESVEMLRKQSDTYLLHEYLEENNNPLYFYQFVEKAQKHGMKFLGESNIFEMMDSRFPQEVQKTLRTIAPDAIHMEQYMDFLSRRTFRQTLIVHQNVAINRNIQPHVVRGMYVSGTCTIVPKADGSKTDLTGTTPEQFQSQRGSITVTDPFIKNALAMLIENAPSSVTFEEILTEARKRGPLPDGAQANPVNDFNQLATSILQCFTLGHVQLSMLPPAYASKPSENPVANALVRAMADGGNRVTNGRHEMIQVNDLDRQVLRNLDGTKTKEQVVENLLSLIGTGTLSARENNNPVTDPTKLRELFEREYPNCVDRLAKMALLAK
jgi:methyltransferase-like protein